MKQWKTPKGTELQIISLRGKDYLEVKWRIVWFREEHPDWAIETFLISRDANSTLAKAAIKDASGRIIATAHKFEDAEGFADHTEKAETSAIGRALALIGYGTQFCADELDEKERLADSPVARSSAAKPPTPRPQYSNLSELVINEICTCGVAVVWSQKTNKFYCPNFKNKDVEHIRAFSPPSATNNATGADAGDQFL